MGGKKTTGEKMTMRSHTQEADELEQELQNQQPPAPPLTPEAVMAAINKLSAKVDQMSLDIRESKDTIVSQLHEMRNDLKETNLRIDNIEARVTSLEREYDEDKTIVIFGLAQGNLESEFELEGKVSTMLDTLDLGLIEIKRCKRLKSRIQEKPGIVKVELASVNIKVAVLRSKMKLKDGQYAGVYIRSSKSHCERLLEINFRQILNEMPNGKNFRMTGNGRIIRTQVNTQHDNSQTRQKRFYSATSDMD